MTELMTKRWVKTKPILGSDWIIKSGRNVLDAEYHSYVLAAAEQKFKKQIKKKRIDNFYEVVFQMMNVNTLAMSGKLFDETYKEYDDPSVNEFWQNLLKYGRQLDATPPEDRPGAPLVQTPGFQILKNARDVLLGVMKSYFDIILTKMDNVKMTINNPGAHLEKTTFVILRVSGFNIWNVWEISLESESPFGKIREIGAWEWDRGSGGAELKAGVLEHNADPANAQINYGNTVVAEMEMADDHRSVAQMVKDLILFNRFFIGIDQDFNPDIFMLVKQKIDQTNAFPFSLVIV